MQPANHQSIVKNTPHIWGFTPDFTDQTPYMGVRGLTEILRCPDGSTLLSGQTFSTMS
jgi:hypothetical protein